MFQLYLCFHILDSGKIWVSKIFANQLSCLLHSCSCLVVMLENEFIVSKIRLGFDPNFIYPKYQIKIYNSNQVFADILQNTSLTHPLILSHLFFLKLLDNLMTTNSSCQSCSSLLYLYKQILN